METFEDAFQYSVSDATDTAKGNVDLTLKGDKITIEPIEQSLPTAASLDIDLITDGVGQVTGTTNDIDLAGRDDAWCSGLSLEPILEPTDAFAYLANDPITAAPGGIAQGVLETPRIETQSHFDLANNNLNKDDLGSWNFNEVQTALRVVLNAADDVLASVDNPLVPAPKRCPT